LQTYLKRCCITNYRKRILGSCHDQPNLQRTRPSHSSCNCVCSQDVFSQLQMPCTVLSLCTLFTVLRLPTSPHCFVMTEWVSSYLCLWNSARYWSMYSTSISARNITCGCCKWEVMHQFLIHVLLGVESSHMHCRFLHLPSLALTSWQNQNIEECVPFMVVRDSPLHSSSPLELLVCLWE
jgi:hypothetical protein